MRPPAARSRVSSRSAENDFFLRSFKALGVAEETWRAKPSPVTKAISETIAGTKRSTRRYMNMELLKQQRITA